MARLGCKCGAEMSNTMAPSKNNLNVYYICEAKEAIQNNPNIKLWDFYTGWDEINNCKDSFQKRDEDVEYWYCTECKRLYEVQAVSCGKILKTYEPCENKDIIMPDILCLDELIFLWDVEMDELLSKNDKMTLTEYLAQTTFPKYYISKDKKTIYVVDNVGCVRFYKQVL